jgi:hypothetical protein
MRAMIMGVVLISLALVACGSHHSSERGGSRSTSAANSNSGAAPPKLSPDVAAYIEIARASGSLRSSAARAALGQAVRLANTAAVATFVPLVAKLRPRDGGLVVLREMTRSALEAALGAGTSRGAQRAAAVAAVRATDAINRGLRRYAAHHPQLASLIPD